MNGNGRASDKASRDPSSCYVVVTMGGRLFAFDADSFQGELIVEERTDQVVSADGSVYHPLAITDALGIFLSEDSPDRRVLLLAHKDQHGSIAVDRVHGQVACQPSEIVPLPLHFQGVEREWYQGMILFQKSVAMILNIPWVLCGSRLDGTKQPEWSMDSV